MTSAPGPTRRAERLPALRADLTRHATTRMGVVLASTNALLFALMSLAQWAGWGGWYTASQLTGAATLAQALGVTGVNLGYGLLVVAGTFALRPMSWPPRTRYLIIAAVALVASLPRVAGLRAIYSTPSGAVFAIAEWVAGFAAGFVAVSAGVLTAQLVTRARDEETRRLREARRAARAVEELQTEEMRVRRMVSDQLHGTLQHRLVAVTAGLDGLAARLATTDEAAAAELREWAERLEEVRDQEVRSLSHAVFPSGVELGAHRAIEQMLRRLPVRLATSLEIGPEYRRLSDAGQEPLPLAERLVAVYTVEEAVTNALKHGRATQVRVAAEVRPADRSAPGGPWLLDVTVDDDGTGLPDGEPELFGLARHAERLQSRGGSLRLGPSPLGGARVRVSLPFDRTPGATEPGTPPAE